MLRTNSSNKEEVVFDKMKKHTLQLIVNYDVMRDAKEVKFAKVGKSVTRFRLN